MDSQAQAAAERAHATGHTLAAKAGGAEEAVAEAGSNCFPVPPHRGDVTVADDDEVRGRRNRLEDAFVVLGKSVTVAQLGGQHRRTPAREELCSLAKEA